MKINCLIIDDEPLARDGLANYVKDIDFLNIAGLCESAMEADHMLNQCPIDLMFLDVQMSRLNGIDFLKSLKHPPLVILTTAYPQYALDGFQLDVLDYLLKPITFDRFYQAANRARSYFSMQQASGAHQHPVAQQASFTMDSFFVKVEKKLERIMIEDIFFVESMQNYVIIHTIKGKHTTLLTLRNIEEKLPKELFLRIHKSYLVALSKVSAIEGNQVLSGKEWLPISRNYKQDFMDKILDTHSVLKKNE